MEKTINSSASPNSMYLRSATQIPTKGANDKYLFFAFGINDVGLNAYDLTTAQFSSDYQYVLNNAFAQGWLPKDIVLVNIYYCNERSLLKQTDPTGATTNRLAAFNAALRSTADENGTRFIDINTFMKTNDANYLLSSDGVHPSNTGYAVIARGIEEALSKF